MASDPVELRVEQVSLSFGGIQALTDVSFDVGHNEIVGIVGPNGAGKTSMLNCISGFYRPQKGGVYYRGRQLTKLPPHAIAKSGVARTFQGAELFPLMTTVENIMVGRHIFLKEGVLSGAVYLGRASRMEAEQRRKVEEIIDFLDLQPVRHQVVSTLSYGWRKRVDLARALALEPSILLLDEPMAGLSIEAKEDQTRYLLDVFSLRHIPIVIVEHDMSVVMDICNRVIVLDFGFKIADGPPDEVMMSSAVRRAYWGGHD